MKESYRRPEKFGDISEFEPTLAKRFVDHYNSGYKERLFSACGKALIALAVSHTIQ